MAFDAFLKIDGIDGESTAQGHEKWIELLSFSWGAAAANAAAANAGAGGRNVGKVSPQDFTFTKVTDSTSPKLFLNVSKGSHFQKVSLACRNASTDSAAAGDFLKIDFSNVIITSLDEGGNKATDPRPLESISFVFQKVAFSFAAPPSASGLPAAAFVNESWDFSASMPE